MTTETDLLQEAVDTLRGMVNANAAAWDMPHDEFCTEYMAWSKNRSRAFLAKIDAMPAGDVLRVDEKRYRFLCEIAEKGAVRTQLPLYRCHYIIVPERTEDHPTFNAAVDAAMLAASQRHGGVK